MTSHTSPVQSSMHMAPTWSMGGLKQQRKPSGRTLYQQATLPLVCGHTSLQMPQTLSLSRYSEHQRPQKIQHLQSDPLQRHTSASQYVQCCIPLSLECTLLDTILRIGGAAMASMLTRIPTERQRQGEVHPSTSLYSVTY